MKRAKTANGRLVIVSGLSGSGKSTAVKVFEDLGFHCVDNLPIKLLPSFTDLARASGERFRRVAMGIDIRERDLPRTFPPLFRELRRRMPVELLFLESAPRVLARRFSETRRPHPLTGDGSLARAISRESRLMAPIRRLADRVIDTSGMTVHDLKKLLGGIYGESGEGGAMHLTLTSFGFKYGIPEDSDIVLDVRFLPNPHFVEDLRRYSGRNQRVRSFILSFPQTKEFLRRTEDLLRYLLPLYAAEGKAYLRISLGCTGGRHRSVALIEELRRLLAAGGNAPRVIHRDMNREE